MERSEQLNELADALSKAQGELEGSKKDAKGYGYDYTKLETVIATAKPVLAKHGLSVSQLLGDTTETSVSCTTMLLHKSGQFIASTQTLPIVEMKKCNKAQEAGASQSYLKRYAYMSIIGMATEDNDASSEGGFESRSDEGMKKPEAPATRRFRRPAQETSDDI